MRGTAILMVAMAALPLVAAGCSVDSQTGKRTGTGAAAGAAAGAAIPNKAGRT